MSEEVKTNLCNEKSATFLAPEQRIIIIRGENERSDMFSNAHSKMFTLKTYKHKIIFSIINYNLQLLLEL